MKRKRVNLEPCRLIFFVSMETMTKPEIHHLWPQMCKRLDPHICFHFYFLHIHTLCQAATWHCGAHINYEPWLSCRAFNHNDFFNSDHACRCGTLNVGNSSSALPPLSARNVSFSCYNMTVHSPCLQAEELDTGHKRVKKALSNSSYTRDWQKHGGNVLCLINDKFFTVLSISLLSDHYLKVK